MIPTLGAIIPAAVGVDIGCGMIAARTSLVAADLPDNLHGLRSFIEQAVPHGKTFGRRDRGAWHEVPEAADQAWRALAGRFGRSPTSTEAGEDQQPPAPGTLGTGNHFIEVCLDETTASGSCCTAVRAGSATPSATCSSNWPRRTCASTSPTCRTRTWPTSREGSRCFDDYVEAVGWAQDFARQNRALMMHAVIEAARQVIRKPFEANLEAVDCHHNYVQKGRHSARSTGRKGAVSAQKDPARHHSRLDGGGRASLSGGLGNQGSVLLVLPRRRADHEPTGEGLQRRRPGAPPPTSNAARTPT